jgi:superfamily I DNA/RNA helicase
LAVTFTNKAANEMKERLMKISKEISAAKREKGQTEETIE